MILLVVGARPNFMKLAPIVRAFEKKGFTDYKIVHTGQHYDRRMSDVFFEEMGIPTPHANLGVRSGSHTYQIATMMLLINSWCREAKPDTVVVVGDVNSTIAGALAASKMGCRLAHVEAGIRSFDRSMPEELNRIVTDALADLCFAPNYNALDNLTREGCRHRSFLVGDVMIDNLIYNLDRLANDTSISFDEQVPKEPYAFATLHRPFNVDVKETLESNLQALAKIAESIPVIFSVHPRTLKSIGRFDLFRYLRAITLRPPLSSLMSIALMQRAAFVVTDSGGMQVETSYLNVPCFTARNNTEWWDTLESGTNTLVGAGSINLVSEAQKVLDGAAQHKVSMRDELWDGKATERIVEVLLNESAVGIGK